MVEKVMTIVEQMKTLTLLETAELVKQIEKSFGVKASPMQVRAIAPVVPEVKPKPVEVKMVDVVLETIPLNRKAAIIRAVWNLTGLDLRNAKNLVNSAPSILKSAVLPEEGLKIKENLESFGANIALK
ncbi:MAG: ribosomal protein L7/L12 [Cyanobacteria bacterium P01_E01_bin.42]